MNIDQTLGSLALDLRRVAQGYYRGSEAVADRFAQEAKVKKEKLLSLDLKPYLRNLLLRMDDIFKQDDHKKIAEDILMYSTLFQNASLKR